MNDFTPQHFMALSNYLRKASEIVPVTMAEGNILSPLMNAINMTASGALICVFESTEPTQENKQESL
jgi:hypothetical protein